MEKKPLFRVVAVTTLSDGSVISTLEPYDNWSFASVVRVVAGERSGTMALREHTISQKQYAEMVVLTNAGEETGLRDDVVYPCFSFRETEDSEKELVVFLESEMIGCPDDSDEWESYARILIRNIDLSKSEGIDSGPEDSVICVGEGPGVMALRPFL